MLKAFLQEKYKEHFSPNVDTWAMIVIKKLESDLNYANRRIESMEKSSFRLDRP